MAACGQMDAQNKVLKLATTTSVEDSGLLGSILPDFKSMYGVEVDVIAVGSGQAIALGERGDVDIVLSHAPALEKEFVANGYGLRRTQVMYNDFVIVGPPEDPAEISAASSPEDALTRIAETGSLFVSRGDNSGTHLRELDLWGLLFRDIPENEDWYYSLGQGMGATLNFADQEGGYTITDRGTFLSQSANLPRLAILYSGDPLYKDTPKALMNDYSIMPVNPDLHPGINHAAALNFEDWITSVGTQSMIDRYGKDKFHMGLFIPDSAAWVEKQVAGENETAGTIQAADAAKGGFFQARLLEIVWMTARVTGLALVISCLIGIPFGVILGISDFPGKKVLQTTVYTAMGLPPVVVGLVVFLLLSQQGPLGFLDWLFSPSGMVIAQTILAFPLAAGLTARAVADVPDKLVVQLRSMGADVWQERWAVFREARGGVLAAVLAALGRIISEVGAAMLVGGNIAGKTRVLSTAIVLETRQGNFELALALGMILLGIALLSNMFVLRLGGEWRI